MSFLCTPTEITGHASVHTWDMTHVYVGYELFAYMQNAELWDPRNDRLFAWHPQLNLLQEMTAGQIFENVHVYIYVYIHVYICMWQPPMCGNFTTPRRLNAGLIYEFTQKYV